MFLYNIYNIKLDRTIKLRNEEIIVRLKAKNVNSTKI